MKNEIVTADMVVEKLLLGGFKLLDADEQGERHFSRHTIVGAPPDADGDKVYVHATVAASGLCGMAVVSPTPHGWANIEYTDVDPIFFHRNLKTMERQVIGAWRELAD